ncbi:DUF6302 family protein [Streptomyces tricolor]|uniref:DUF6302 family protein n=1 Tax=Streptomyces tricolor TaxID=68277 RepID=A0ABS9J9I7_9ACTN|nr:DUF6302 family protein [Streptomyces tricolor]MCG0062220.1 DUF6302 family protein [Streptomyces tricolor]
MTVAVRPHDHREEWEASWYRERLADPSLLAASIAVVIGRTSYLAVPVGPGRHGGYISIGGPEAACYLHRALAGRAGFPAVRIRWSAHPSVYHVVEWGEPVPETEDDTVRGAFYGYSARAIRSFTEELTSREQ